MADPMITRSFDIEVREDDGKKCYEFTAATERAVDTPWGPEVLRMSGVNLKRFRSNPVVLDTHNRGDLSAIVGRANMKREGTELAASIEFADTPRAQIAQRLVDTGFLRTVSVGFIPRKVRNVRKGETDGDAEGPCRVISQWELIELSLVPVPADAEALARSHYFPADGAERQEEAMRLSDVPAPEPAQPAADPTPETPEPQVRQADPAPAPVEDETEATIKARRLIDEEIRRLGDIAGCADEAASLIVQGASLTEARQAFAESMRSRSKPVGTPEPTPSTPETRKPSVDAETLRDSFKRL